MTLHYKDNFFYGEILQKYIVLDLNINHGIGLPLGVLFKQKQHGSKLFWTFDVT